MSKVVARIFGGLGNQLFIYATARAIAHKNKASLFLDTKTGFQNDSYQREFALGNFCIQYKNANRLQSFDFPGGRFLKAFSRKFSKHLPQKNQYYYSDLSNPPIYFNQKIKDIKSKKSVWLEGYWQSPKYFEEIRDILIDEIKIKKEISKSSKEILENIKNTNSVCIHYRMLRNYINKIKVTDANELESNYFLQAIDIINSQIESPHFFVFSDNPAGVQQTLPNQNTFTFISHNQVQGTDYEDFYLMQHCKHFILSNSTFGWWPAWLSQNETKIVITPHIDYWDNADILPASWLQITPKNG